MYNVHTFSIIPVGAKPSKTFLGIYITHVVFSSEFFHLQADATVLKGQSLKRSLSVVRERKKN